MTDEKQQNKTVKLNKEWPERLKGTLVVLLFMLVVSSIIFILRNNVIDKQIYFVENYLIDFIGNNYFKLDNVFIEGRKRTEVKQIKDIIKLKRGDNLLKVDIKKIKRLLEGLPWVRDVAVKRSFLPNIVKIEIQERKVLALWQLNEIFYPIDTDGYVIEAEYKADEPLLLIVGADAAENFIPLLKTIKKYDEKYFERIKAANFISKRRWNIILDDIKDGITIKLPEKDVEQAWQKLIKLDKQKGILKRKLTIIDLRLNDKITVKLKKTKVLIKRSEYET